MELVNSDIANGMSLTISSGRNELSCRQSQYTCTRDKGIRVPFGLNLTTLTAAVCLLSVERYSTRGGCEGTCGPELDGFPAAAIGVGKILGLTNQIYCTY